MKSIALFLSFCLSTNAFAEAPPKYLASEQKKVLGHAALDAYARFFNEQVKSGADAERVLFAKLPAKERRQNRTFFAKLGAAPKISRRDDTLVLQFPKSELKIRWPDTVSNQVFIEGESWAFDPGAPLKFQIDNLNEKVKAAARRAEQSAFFKFVIPEANAAAPAIVAACMAINACTWAAIAVGGAIVGNWGGKIAGAVTETTYDVSCYVIASQGYKPWNSIGWCREWKTANDEWRKKAAAAETVDKDPNLEWVAGNPKCPPKDDKGVELFDAYMAEIRKKANGDWPEQANWSRLLAKTKEGNITEAYLFETTANATLENVTSAQRKFTFTKDKEPALESVSFRKPDGTYLTLLTTDEATDIPPEYRAEMVKMKAMVEAARAWAKTCRTLARAGKVAPATVDAATKVMQRQELKPTEGETPSTK